MTRDCLVCAIALCFVLPLRAADAPEPANIPARPATALLHIAQVRNDPADYRIFRNTQAVLIQSRRVLNGALRQPGIAELELVKGQKDPIDWLADNLRVTFPQDCEVLSVSLRVGKPAEAARLVNAVVEAYLAEIVGDERKRLVNRLEQLQKIYGDYDDMLRTKRRNLRRLMEELGTTDDKVRGIRQEFLVKELNVVQTELLGLRSELRKMQVELATQEAKEKEPRDVPSSAVNEFVEQDPTAQQLKGRIAALQAELDQLRARLADFSGPEVDRRRKDLQAARAALEARRNELLPVFAKELQDKLRTEDKARTAALRGRIDSLKKLEKMLTVEVEERTKSIPNYGRNNIDLQGLREEIRLVEEMARKVGAEVESLKVELITTNRITLIEKAEVPGKEK